MKYPALFLAADEAAKAAQRTHMRLLRLQLLLLVLAAAAAALAPLVDDQALMRGLFGGTAVLMALALALLWIIRAQTYEKSWFDCRAIAESVKTATWHFSMRAAPYSSAGDAQIENAFLDRLVEIRQARPGVESQLGGRAAGVPEITDEMRRVRALPCDARLELYVRERLEDQRSWYHTRAADNRTGASRWFWAVAVAQLVALCLSIGQAVFASRSGYPVSFLMTIAAAFLAWTQVKRHGELTQTYSLAAQELGILKSLAPRTSDDTSLAELVGQVEEAISREHTLWCTRRAAPVDRWRPKPGAYAEEK